MTTKPRTTKTPAPVTLPDDAAACVRWAARATRFPEEHPRGGLRRPSTSAACRALVAFLDAPTVATGAALAEALHAWSANAHHVYDDEPRVLSLAREAEAIAHRIAPAVAPLRVIDDAEAL